METILFLFRMNLLIFQNKYEFKKIIFTLTKTTFLKKKLGYNRATVSTLTRKIFMYDMESCYENVPKIPNATFIFQT